MMLRKTYLAQAVVRGHAMDGGVKIVKFSPASDKFLFTHNPLFQTSRGSSVNIT